jgi:hypothetical protein
VGPELHINTITSNAQMMSDTASQPAANGKTVHVWVHKVSADNTDIRAQIYNGSGSKVGGEIVVASSVRYELDPAVAVDLQGNFVVVWTDQVSSSNVDIKARRFSSSGAALGGSFTVAGDSRNEWEPDVAKADNGDFVVSYTLDYSSTDKDVKAKRFNSAGTLLGTVNVAVLSRNEHDSSVARTADGRFAVAYQDDVPRAGGGVNTNIKLKRYSSAGALLGTHDIANTDPSEWNPDVAMDRDGNTVVVYQFLVSAGDSNIRARKVNEFGTMGAVMGVTSSSDYEVAPAVAMDLTPGDGDFVVAYGVPEGGGWFPPRRVFVREMFSGGGAKATHDLGLQGGLWDDPAISINGSDSWFVSYGSGNRPDDPDGGIFGRRGTLV